MYRSRIYGILLLFINAGLSAQDEDSPFELQGYLTNMQSVILMNPGGDWIIDNLSHNRLNFFWYGGEHFTGTIQLRNRLMIGETLKIVPGYADAIGNDIGWMDLSHNLISGKSYVLNTAIDRIWLQYSTGSFVATAGRQRINWGQTFVWNVNDIFNAYSYFDFDYEERPGSDAIRLEFYPNYTSAIELAAKLDSSNRLTAAAMYRFNVFSYDIQVLAGVLQEEDYMGGLGWSGNIGGAGFRGEASYFHPVNNPGDTNGMFMVSAGLEYIFPNTLMLQAEYLFSSKPFSSDLGFVDLYSGPLTVKQLAFAEHTFFAAGSYQITPILTASLASMYYPELKGYFFSPSLSLNALKNVDLSIFYQYFNTEGKDPTSGTLTRHQMNLWFLRLKWSF
ncbi:hypothetical protein ACFLR8_00310 [Bacteroidota bacterium]